MYKNINEILLGFDVDSCSILYDGKQFYISERCEHALIHHQNVVDFTRMSPTYEYRLYKYFLKGFDIVIPKFQYSKIDTSHFKSIPSAHLKLKLDQNNGQLKVYLQPLRSRSRVNKSAIIANRLSSYGVQSSSEVPQSQNIPHDAKYSQKKKSKFFLGFGNGTKRKSMEEETDQSKDEIDTDTNTNTINGIDVMDPGSYLSDVAKGTIVVRKNIYEISLPLIRTLQALDILLFLCFQVVGNVRAGISDYGIDVPKHKSCLFCNNLGKIITIPPKFFQITLRYHSRRYHSSQPSGQKIMIQNLLQEYGFEFNWINQEPGKQLTSSFHALVYQSKAQWFNGIYYKDTKQKIDQQCKKKQLNFHYKNKLLNLFGIKF